MARYGQSPNKIEQNFFREQFAYGHREVILQYASMDFDLIFKAVISHGDNYPVYSEHISPIHDFRGQEILQLKWRSDAEENGRAKGIQKIRSIGAIGIYHLLNSGIQIAELKSNINNFSKSFSWNSSPAIQFDQLSNARSVLYFPHHSWEGDVLDHKIPDFSVLNRLDKLKVTVCLGAHDFASPLVRKYYHDKGWEVTCAGMRDSMIPMSPCGGRVQFLQMLLDLMSRADYIVADQITTALFYAALLGKPCGILSEVANPRLEWSSWRDGAELEQMLELTRKHYPWLWGNFIDSGKINREVSTLLGIDSIKTPSFFQEEVPTFSLSNWEK